MEIFGYTAKAEVKEINLPVDRIVADPIDRLKRLKELGFDPQPFPLASQTLYRKHHLR
jgi:hypothetical protein